LTNLYIPNPIPKTRPTKGINLTITSVSLNVLATKNGVPYLRLLQTIIPVVYATLKAAIFLIALLFILVSNIFYGVLNIEKRACNVNYV
jgi:hypothetical protein